MSENNVNCYDFDDYRLDLTNFQLLENGESISLTQKSFELLHFLLENRGRILKKEELLDALWEGNFVEEANLTQHIYMLRKALKQQERKKLYIETIPKNGYRFLAQVDELYIEPIHISSNGKFSERHEAVDFLNNNFQSDFLDEHGKSPKQFTDSILDPSQVDIRQNNYSNRTFAMFAVALFLFISAGTYYYLTYNSNEAGLSKKPKSYAVLPFKQIDGEKDEKLGVGVADVLIARLANIEEISVSPTTSIIRFANEDNSDLAEVGRKLNVDCIIAGTIQRDNGTVRVTTQLYSVKERRQLWTDTIDEKYSDIFTLQDKISEKVAQKILMDLDVGSSALPYRQYTKSIEAYQAYSMGLSYWNMHTKEGFENAIRQFNKAIDFDPHFTLAYAYLADTYGHTGHIKHLMSADEARKKGEEAEKDALELDSNCAEALAALALIYANRDRQSEAFDLMTKSLEIKPNDAHSRHRISWMYANKGQIERAVKEMKIARKLDPQSAYINLFLGEMLSYAKQPDAAIEAYEKALQIEPNSGEARWHLILAHEQKGSFEEAENQLNLLAGNNFRKDHLLVKSRLYAKGNKKEQAREILKLAIAKDKTRSFDFLIAQTYIALGENDKAVKLLVSIIPEVKDNIYYFKYDPNLDPVRDIPQFSKVLKAKENAQGW